MFINYLKPCKSAEKVLDKKVLRGLIFKIAT